MLESGKVRSLREIARKEGVDSSYVSRMVNLTTLAPDIVEAIFDETLPPEVSCSIWRLTRRCCEVQRERVDWTSRSHVSKITHSAVPR
jgi:hypothetical protein